MQTVFALVWSGLMHGHLFLSEQRLRQSHTVIARCRSCASRCTLVVIEATRKKQEEGA
jgi:hypothetical protein